jgi:hypothetical protein
LTQLTVNGIAPNELLLNNIPPSSNIQILELYSLEIELGNLPSTIKKIKLLSDWRKKSKDLLKKIPFGCEVEIPITTNY